jgi:tetratricopeptide (TPR) repeat protein
MRRGIGPKRKGLFVLLFMQVILLRTIFAYGYTLEEAASRYRSGALDEAKHILLDIFAQQKSDPQVLLLLAQTEESGAVLKRYLEDAQNYLGWTDLDQVRLLACKYEFCRDRYVTTVELSENFKTSFAGSRIVPEALWLSGSSLLAMEKTDSARADFDRILESYPGSPRAQWAALAKGDCFFLDQDYDRALTEYHQVLKQHRDSEAFPFALSGLVRCYSRLNDSDKALLYYNLLKEKFPRSMELGEMFVPRTAPPDKDEDQERAEELGGVRYTIQLGVFGVRENALRLRSRFQEQGYSVRIESKTIATKKYSVVQLGSFTSYEEASKLKKELESQTGESYRVVIR